MLHGSPREIDTAGRIVNVFINPNTGDTLRSTPIAIEVDPAGWPVLPQQISTAQDLAGWWDVVLKWMDAQILRLLGTMELVFSPEDLETFQATSEAEVGTSPPAQLERRIEFINGIVQLLLSR